MKTVTFLSTWHPAYVGYEEARAARSFLIHVKKAVDIAFGKKPDPLPKILYNPPAGEAGGVFRRWKDGFAIDIETPSLTDHRILSIAVSGHEFEAMVWSLEGRPALGPLRKYLRNDVTKVFQNGEFDLPILEKNGFKITKSSCWDTMIENAILFPDEPVNLSFLTSLASDVEAWKHLREGNLLFYNALDACYDWRVYVSTLEAYEEFEYD